MLKEWLLSNVYIWYCLSCVSQSQTLHTGTSWDNVLWHKTILKQERCNTEFSHLKIVWTLYLPAESTLTTFQMLYRPQSTTHWIHDIIIRPYKHPRFNKTYSIKTEMHLLQIHHIYWTISRRLIVQSDTLIQAQAASSNTARYTFQKNRLKAESST